MRLSLRLCSLYMYADKIVDPDTDRDMYYAVPLAKWLCIHVCPDEEREPSARMNDRLLRPKMAKGSVLCTSMITWSVGAA